MSKHTPKPWVIKFRNDHSAYISMGNPSSEHKQFDIELDNRYPPDVADAHLIASAPDLLEACREARVWLLGWASAERQLAVLDAAIAKATGSAQ